MLVNSESFRGHISGNVNKEVACSVELIDRKLAGVAVAVAIDCDFFAYTRRPDKLSVAVKAQSYVIQLVARGSDSFPYTQTKIARRWRPRSESTICSSRPAATTQLLDSRFVVRSEWRITSGQAKATRFYVNWRS